jgi:anti-sigma28 factor (negative regulator of flagellin synthesis)
MRINALTQTIHSELRKVENARKTEKASNSAHKVPTDHSEISSGAQKLHLTKASIDIISSTLEAQSDIRTEKISEVQEKIKNGYYNSPEFIDRLAEQLLAEFGIKAPPQ